MKNLLRLMTTAGAFILPLSAMADRPLACLFDKSAGGETVGRPFIGAKCVSSVESSYVFWTKTQVKLVLKTEAGDKTYSMSDLEECHAILFALNGKIPTTFVSEPFFPKANGEDKSRRAVPYLRIEEGYISRKISYGKLYDTECSPVVPGEHEHPLSVAQSELAERKSARTKADQKAKDDESAASPSRLGDFEDGPGRSNRRAKPDTADMGVFDYLKKAAEERGWITPADPAQ